MDRGGDCASDLPNRRLSYKFILIPLSLSGTGENFSGTVFRASQGNLHPRNNVHVLAYNGYANFALQWSSRHHMNHCAATKPRCCNSFAIASSVSQQNSLPQYEWNVRKLLKNEVSELSSISNKTELAVV